MIYGILTKLQDKKMAKHDAMMLKIDHEAYNHRVKLANYVISRVELIAATPDLKNRLLCSCLKAVARGADNKEIDGIFDVFIDRD